MSKRRLIATIGAEQTDMLPGLIRRGARYHIVRGIPKDLQGHYGRTVYTKALGTPDPEEARKRVVKAWGALDDECEGAPGTQG